MQAVLLTPLKTFAAGVLFAVAVLPAPAADIELPGIVVTGSVPTKPPDIVSKDRDQRSPDVHWSSTLSPERAEMFAHNEIEINAPCATVWNYLVQAELWPQWFPKCGKVEIKGGSPVLQKNTKFTWSGFDLPLENRFQAFPPPPDAKVIECVPESRIGWVSYATSSIYGPICDAYHNWFLVPTGAKKCHVVFEEVATGVAAVHARGNYPEVLHLSHQRWLEELKKVSESGTVAPYKS
jgi:Polyketide cyclase / dehydrase and lipid transport